jgi:hypothetical protein
MFFPISPSPPRGRMRTLGLLKLGGAPGQEALRLQGPPDLGPLLVVRFDDRQPCAGGADPEHLEARLHGDRVGLAADLVDRAKPIVDLPRTFHIPRLHRVVDLAHLAAREMRGDEDPAGLAHLEGAQEGPVVAGEDPEALDRLQLLVVRLLHADDVVDLRELGELLQRDVHHCTRGDVVEDDRNAGRPGDRLVVGPDPGEVGLVVVRRHRQHGVGAGVRRRRRELLGVSCVV